MSKQDLDYSFKAVPKEARKGFLSMFVIMLGFTFFSASMLSGGTLGTSLTSKEFILAVLLGNFVLACYTGGLAFIGAKTGLSTHLLSHYSFGEKGSYLSSFLLSFTQIGWFGVGVVMFALPVSKVTGINTYILVVISGILMTLTAYYGIKAVTILSAIAVPSIAILGSTSVFQAVSSVGGLNELLATAPTSKISFISGVSICIASFISGGTLTADFARFAKTTKSSVSSTVIAFFIGNSLMFIFGAVGARVFATNDISDVMLAQGLIIPAVIVLGFNIWTTNDNALYSSGLGFSNITKIKKSKLVIINGILGTIFAVPIYNNFISWLGILNTFLPAIGAIIIADFFIVNKGNYPKNMTIKSINYNAIGAWVVGVLGATFLPGIPAFNGVIFAITSYTFLSVIPIKAIFRKRATI